VHREVENPLGPAKPSSSPLGETMYVPPPKGDATGVAPQSLFHAPMITFSLRGPPAHVPAISVASANAGRAPASKIAHIKTKFAQGRNSLAHLRRNTRRDRPNISGFLWSGLDYFLLVELLA
jgi:hypothetical protein